MKRSLILGGVGLLALVLTAGVSFGHSPNPTKPTKTPTTPKTTNTTKTTNTLSNMGTSGTGNQPSTMGTGAMNEGNKNGMKTGKKKPHHKSGKHKHKHHHKNHHHKHHKEHHHKVAFVADGTDGAAVGADDEDDPEIEGDFGLLITDIDEAGPAAEAGLDVDDTILSVNGVRVQTVEEMRAALKKVTGPVKVVYISDDTDDVEEVEVTPKDGKMGITMEVVKLDDDDDDK